MKIKEMWQYMSNKISRCTLNIDLKIFAVKRVDYIEIGEDWYLGPNVTITPFGGWNHKEFKN